MLHSLFCGDMPWGELYLYVVPLHIMQPLKVNEFIMHPAFSLFVLPLTSTVRNHTHTHTHIYIYIYIYLDIAVWKFERWISLSLKSGWGQNFDGAVPIYTVAFIVLLQRGVVFSYKFLEHVLTLNNVQNFIFCITKNKAVFVRKAHQLVMFRQAFARG